MGMAKSLTTRAYEIVQDWMDSNEDFVLLKIKEGWPNEYAAAVAASIAEDKSRSLEDDHVPNLSFVCEQVKRKDEEKFLSYLARNIV